MIGGVQLTVIIANDCVGPSTFQPSTLSLSEGFQYWGIQFTACNAVFKMSSSEGYNMVIFLQFPHFCGLAERWWSGSCQTHIYKPNLSVKSFRGGVRYECGSKEGWGESGCVLDSAVQTWPGVPLQKTVLVFTTVCEADSLGGLRRSMMRWSLGRAGWVMMLAFWMHVSLKAAI